MSAIEKLIEEAATTIVEYKKAADEARATMERADRIIGHIKAKHPNVLQAAIEAIDYEDLMKRMVKR